MLLLLWSLPHPEWGAGQSTIHMTWGGGGGGDTAVKVLLYISVGSPNILSACIYTVSQGDGGRGDRRKREREGDKYVKCV